MRVLLPGTDTCDRTHLFAVLAEDRGAAQQPQGLPTEQALREAVPHGVPPHVLQPLHQAPAGKRHSTGHSKSFQGSHQGKPKALGQGRAAKPAKLSPFPIPAALQALACPAPIRSRKVRLKPSDQNEPGYGTGTPELLPAPFHSPFGRQEANTHTQSLQQPGWERGGRQDEQLGCGEHAERGCSAARSLLGNLQASICRGDSSSQAIYQPQHQEGAILPSMNPTLISANVPATRAPSDSRAMLLARGCARGGEVRLHSQSQPSLADLSSSARAVAQNNSWELTKGISEDASPQQQHRAARPSGALGAPIYHKNIAATSR